MSGAKRNVLFLCTGNSARSVFCESYLNFKSRGRFAAYSAGSHPKGEIHPLTLDTLAAANLDTAGLRSKSWDEFAAPGAVEMQFVITVCDSAAGEICPVWPGQPISAHWSFSDPAAFEGSKYARVAIFREVFRQIRNRVDLFLALPFERLDRLAVAKELKDIGRSNV
jgi:arsenate reductase (thioredoxin)